MTIDLHEEDCGCTEYRELSRRQFVGTAAAGSMAAVAASYFPAWLPKVVLAESHAAARDSNEQADLMRHLIAEQKRTNLLLGLALYFGVGLALGVVLLQFFMRWHHLL